VGARADLLRLRLILRLRLLLLLLLLRLQPLLLLQLRLSFVLRSGVLRRSWPWVEPVDGSEAV